MTMPIETVVKALEAYNRVMSSPAGAGCHIDAMREALEVALETPNMESPQKEAPSDPHSQKHGLGVVLPEAPEWLAERSLPTGRKAKTAKERQEAPKGCMYNSMQETCSVCGHPEYCPAYGN